MGTGRRMFLLIISRIVCLIVKVWSFLSSFVTSGTIGWNASEEFKAICEYVVARTSKGLSAKGRARERKIELVPGAGGCTG